MADSTAQGIISAALSTARSHPGLSAVEVLDLAMTGHQGCDICFEAGPADPFDDWLDPPSPFADLLRQAFAPAITTEQTALWHSPDEFVAAGFRDMWDADVVQRFGQRYRLWQD